MKNVLLNIYEFDGDWAYETLKHVLLPGMKVAVLTMSHGDEIPDTAVWENLYLPGGKIHGILTHTFAAYGIPAENVTFLSWYHHDVAYARKVLEKSDALFMTGGLPDRFCDRIRQWDIEKDIRSFPGVIIGVSAGAMMQMKEYHITPDEDYDSFGYYEGLGLLDGFEPEVHFCNSEVQRESIARYLSERKKPVYAMTNQGGLLVEDGRITMLGDVTLYPEEQA